MKTTILTFGIAKEIFNGASKEMNLKDGITVAELKNSLEAAYPEMKKLHSYLIAVNNEYAEDDLVLDSADEIAIIPPVSGG
ncbi:MoaD/ThiS family protein [Agriterribacter humi]|jgi:molybdopterin converting factor subunit 1|uniref:MoaD/ThiS family protein n=1 Tax=Agriterribacter humi TaxID=1104781 RepID=UPI0012648FF0|nr:MoaD/ThiS family protein [Agriterribacter humi]